MIKKNITYAQRSKSKNLLDVVYGDVKKNLPVIFFIHGGSWMNGGKDLYTALAGNFVEKGFVSVVISYRLYPATDVFGMVEDCRDAFKWCKENIKDFGGDPGKIYLAGHSAGGHLAAVTGLQEKGNDSHVAGFILIDAFGLCAHYFLTNHQSDIPDFFAGVFGKEKNKWESVSPEKLVKKGVPPFLLLTGGNTYPFITFDNTRFMHTLDEYSVKHEQLSIASKSHMQMIYEFEHGGSAVFNTILDWMKKAGR